MFAQKYPGKKLMLVTDNASYHHAREFGSLLSYSKSKLIDLMTKHKVNYINLHFVIEERFALTNIIGEYNDDVMESKGVCTHISFVCDEQLGCSSKNTSNYKLG